MNAVDTNVLIYVHDTRDAVKQQSAFTLIASLQSRLLLWQVACEYLAAYRKLAPLGYSQATAFRDIKQMMVAWNFVLPTARIFDSAERLLGKYSLSYWDAMLVAGCLDACATRLYTEDFSGYRQIDSLEIVNPFTP
jgi:predicted nucleic acid-binding protein